MTILHDWIRRKALAPQSSAWGRGGYSSCTRAVENAYRDLLTPR